MCIQEYEIDTLTAVAIMHFGNLNNLMRLRNVEFSGVGYISSILARHQPMSIAINDFVTIEPWNDRFRARNEVFEAWEVTRYFEISSDEFNVLSAHSQVVDCNVNASRTCNFVVIPETLGDTPKLRFLEWSQLDQPLNYMTWGESTEIPDKNAFHAHLSEMLGAIILADLGQMVKRMNMAYQAPARHRSQVN